MFRTLPRRDQNIEVRVSAREKRAWQEAARRVGRSLSDWLRDLANRVATHGGDKK